jgi:rhodanese-related sulfurtransferase
MSKSEAEAQLILDIKEKLTKNVPTPYKATPISSAQALKERLDWGEPALTIIDIRDREAYLEERITGAILVFDINQLHKSREIYVYGNTDQEAAKKVEELREFGFESVSQLLGGLAGWKAISGVTEGRAS